MNELNMNPVVYNVRKNSLNQIHIFGVGFEAWAHLPLKKRDAIIWLNDGEVFLDGDFNQTWAPVPVAWVAREEPGDLYIYDEIPSKREDEWHTTHGCTGFHMGGFEDVTWETLPVGISKEMKRVTPHGVLFDPIAINEKNRRGY